MPALFASLVLLTAAAKRKKEKKPIKMALVAGTQQNLSSLYFLDVYGRECLIRVVRFCDSAAAACCVADARQTKCFILCQKNKMTRHCGILKMPL
jgi:hypothetical protein